MSRRISTWWPQGVVNRKMIRRYLRPLFGPRRVFNSFLLFVGLTLFGGVLLWRWLDRAGDVVLVDSLQRELLHLRRSRALQDYVADLENPLIEPSSLPCETEETAVLMLVSSAPDRQQRRQAIRDSWARQLPTYFFLGLEKHDYNDMLVDNYVEAKQFSDLVVYEFTDAYQNLTLKTALMLRWAMQRCPHVGFVMKTDDDVFVNPWTLQQAVKEHEEKHDKIFGYLITGASPHRNPYNKWFLPRWLYPWDTIPEYLSGTGYLIKGKYLQSIYEAALTEPLINLEDIYFTYLVARQSLGLQLVHDERLSPSKPIFPVNCAYWHFALIHSLQPSEILSVWSQIQDIAKDYESGRTVCDSYENYFSAFSGKALLY